ncbi:MAG TPA: hypothetical protein VFW87_03045 [Pirellulales bacterium]|nr:hypothetical protein [Pirellulales bacterium]
MQSSTSVARFQALRQLDQQWQCQRERLLDWGCEPQYPGMSAVATTAAFFLLVWFASVALGRPEWLYAASSISVVALFSFRARSFETAYHDYLRRRGGEVLPAK